MISSEYTNVERYLLKIIQKLENHLNPQKSCNILKDPAKSRKFQEFKNVKGLG